MKDELEDIVSPAAGKKYRAFVRNGISKFRFIRKMPAAGLDIVPGYMNPEYL